jgi:hypothetical protein
MTESYKEIDTPEENHPLLNKDEFATALCSRGYTRILGCTAFNNIMRNTTNSSASERTSHSITYTEETRWGEVEHVISLPNLAANLSEVSDFGNIGTKMMQAMTELTEPYRQDR